MGMSLNHSCFKHSSTAHRKTLGRFTQHVAHLRIWQVLMILRGWGCLIDMFFGNSTGITNT